MAELGPLGPVDPATGRHPNTPGADLLNYWARGPGSRPRRKPATERCYLYRQNQLTSFDTMFTRKKDRPRTYVARVVEDHAGRRTVRTERYDPERGSASRTGHGAPVRVDIPQLPMSMKLPIVFFVLAVTVILMVTIPFPVGLLAAVAWNSVLAWKMIHAVERKRFAQHLRRLPDDLPPLLSAEELDARVFTLANPNEDRTFEDPAPIPLPALLRHRAWKQWSDRYSEDAIREVGKRWMDKPEAFEGPRLSVQLRAAALQAINARDRLRALPDRVKLSHAAEIDACETELSNIALKLGCEIRGIEHPSMLAAPPQLERTFTASTDCADGHVGEHPIIATFVDRLGRQRVTRGCRWCPSEWSELV